MNKWYFTWGFGHRFPNGYHVVEADSAGEARKIMVERFGLKWAFQYNSADAAGVERFHLHEINENGMIVKRRKK